MEDLKLVRVITLRAAGREDRFCVIDANGDELPALGKFLLSKQSGTARTYAYLLVDFVRALVFEHRTEDEADGDLAHRYVLSLVRWRMGAQRPPWTQRKNPPSELTLKQTAAAIKGYLDYLLLSKGKRLSGQVERNVPPAKINGFLLAHIGPYVEANDLAKFTPRVGNSGPPKIVQEIEYRKLLENTTSARDKAIIRWLGDGGFRIGELLGLRLEDLHLGEGLNCPDCLHPHVHVCDRIDNENGARSKSKVPWRVVEGRIRGGSVRRVSPEMIRAIYQYIVDENKNINEHGFLFTNVSKGGVSTQMTTDGARKALNRVSRRAGLEHLHPHMFRHRFATAITKAAGGNTVVTRELGGWKSATTVEQIYDHPSIDDQVFGNALEQVWKNPTNEI